MNRPRHQFLASAAFTADQNRAARPSGRLDTIVQSAHRAARANQIVEDAAVFARHESRLALKRLDPRARSRRCGPEVGIRDEDHADVAELVESRIYREGRWRAGKNLVRAFLEKVKRRHDFRKWHVEVAQQLSGTDSIDRVAIHVAVEEVLGVAQESVVEEFAELHLQQTASIAKVKRIELIPVLDHLSEMLVHQSQDGSEQFQFIVPQEMIMPGSPALS